MPACVMSHIRIRHVACWNVHAWLLSEVGRVPYMNESWHKCVSRDTRMNASCQIYMELSCRWFEFARAAALNKWVASSIWVSHSTRMDVS